MKKFLLLLTILFVGNFLSVTHAEIKNYSASDSAMLDFGEDDEKIIATVKEVARKRAMRAVREKAGIYLQTFSQTVNGVLKKEEISAVASNISEILDVKFEKFYFQAEDAGGKDLGKVGYLYKATVTANFDTNEIAEFINKNAQEKANIVQQNKNAQKSELRVINDFEELRVNAKNKTPEQIKSELAKIDKEILVSDKLDDGNKFAYRKNYPVAISKYNEALEIIPNDYYAKENIEIAEGKANLPDSSEAENYYNRGVLYFESRQYEKAIKDFDMVIKLNPNFEDVNKYREICKKKIAEQGTNKSRKGLGGKNSPKTLYDLKPKKKTSALEDALVAAVIIAEIFKK